MPVTLDPDVYALIMPYLRRPAPIPNGQNSRSSISQRDLMNCMRVSKLFNTLAAPHLYTVVVTSNLPSLVHNLHRTKPTAKGILTKAELLAQTERLFLEYCDKSEPSYTTIFTRGKPTFLLVGQGTGGDDMIHFCGIESDLIFESAKKLDGVMGGLITLSTGAYLGGQIDIWRPIWIDRWEEYEMALRMSEARAEIAKLACHPGRLATFYRCGGHHALPTPKQIRKAKLKGWKGPENLTHRSHIETNEYDAQGSIPAIVGAKHFWTTIAQHIANRKQYLDGMCDHHRPDAAPQPKRWFSVDIYLPEEFMTDSWQRHIHFYIVNGINTVYGQLRMAKPRDSKDIWRLHSIEEAKCEACDWHYGLEGAVNKPIKKHHQPAMNDVMGAMMMQQMGNGSFY